MQEIKLKMSEVIESNEAIKLLEGVKMPIAISISLSNLSDSLKNNVTIYGKQMGKLMDDNCFKDKEGKFIPVDPKDMTQGFQIENKKAYWDGVKELDDTEVPIMYDPIDLGTLEIEFGIVKVLRKFFKTE